MEQKKERIRREKNAVKSEHLVPHASRSDQNQLGWGDWFLPTIVSLPNHVQVNFGVKVGFAKMGGSDQQLISSDKLF